MTSEPKNSRAAHVPAILAGSAALVAALSTLYVNLRGDSAPTPAEPASAAQVAPAAETAAAPPTAAPVAPKALRLRLDRVQVDDDGSVGSTDWSFQVSADEKPLFVVPMPELSDKPGHNLARPGDTEEATAEVQLPPGKNVEISVNGWKAGWLPGAKAEVSGKAWMASGYNGTVVTLKSDKPKGPQFVLYFSVTPTE